MNESNFIERNSIKAIVKTFLSEQTKFRLSEIIVMECYFYQEINQRKSCSKKLNKYVTVFDYIDKTLIVLSPTIISFTSVSGAPVGIVSASLTLTFSLATGIVKKIIEYNKKKKKKKHDKIFMLAESKLNTTESLISQALIDMDI